MKILIADIGAGRTKIVTRGNVRGKERWIEYVQPSYAHALTADEWNAVTARNLQSSGYALINGAPFAFGYTARQYTTVRPEGVARYKRDYLGAVMAYGAVMVNATGALSLVVMHPPNALLWRDHMLDAVSGDWSVTTFTAGGRSKKHHVSVQKVNYLDEPLGGLNNVMITDAGKLDATIGRVQSVMTVDVGAHTTDVAVILERQLRAESLRSVQVGVNGLLDSARDWLRSSHLPLMTVLGNPDIDDARLFSAFQDGYITLGAHHIDLRPFLTPALMRLTNDVNDVMRGSDYSLANMLVITGGGGALLESTLRQAHRPVFQNAIMLAETPDYMQFANARGAYKLASALTKYKPRGNHA